MDIFTKEIDQITEKDLEELEKKPNSFESHRLEYKTFFDITDNSHKNEILRDIIAFVNSSYDSLLIYGITDNRKLVGMAITYDFDGDKFQNFLMNKIRTSIEPNILPFIQAQSLTLTNGKFVFIIKVLSANNEIFGIKQKLDRTLHGKSTNAYEFWIRSSGNKVEMNLTDVVKRIIRKSFPKLILLFTSNKKTYNMSSLLRKHKKQNQLFSKFGLKIRNFGDQAATNVTLKLKFITQSGVIIYNKKDYDEKIKRKKEIEKINLSKSKQQLKKLVKNQQPNIRFRKVGDKIDWLLIYNIDSIRGKDQYHLPYIYINIPKSLKQQVIIINSELRLDQPNDQEEQILKLRINRKTPE